MSTEAEEQYCAINRTQEPQQHVDQVDPDRILHPLHPGVAVRVHMHVDLPKQAENSYPQDARTRFRQCLTTL